MNKKILIIALTAIIVIGIGGAIVYTQINRNITSQKKVQGNSIEAQMAAIKSQREQVSEGYIQKINEITDKQKEQGCIELRDMESTKTVTGEKVIGKEWRVISTEGICGGLQKEKEALSKEMYSKSSQFSAQLDLLTARPELEREKATQAIRDFMAKPDLQLQYIHTRRPSNFNVGIITNQTDNGYTSEDVDGWERKVEVYQQKEYIGNTCEVYEYEVDIRNNDIVQVGIRYPQEDIIENPKKQEECQDSHSLETSLLTLSEIEEIAMGYAQRGVKNFNEIKDKFIYEGSSVNPKAISAHNAWIYENKDYKLPEGLTAELPSKFPTIWSRVSSGGYLIMWLNTTGLFN
ncbi:MAG: hypothetical protein A2528_02850 [Candidatus Staskawiczbacteria bacterium RIFOXYD2_FULL_37_9]|uniref:Uncharacterized protein n=1 Tax=Candidatus Staskawiczbacteria bacterium RIFOXYB1_FULL_37_44 TaxID=1802223 RepID=A0A1G2IY04_9BACT|nr:MAG: hypothetical protein A2358_00730 [Candidatus Staskawiczbacteria bacterium RIFOXYB1_FULL_37_44]OGZ84478.1 MAG: hypothetical protein A2416_03005 [Candidatus Staskawiczbacteria bacterium RIFOXYC1_FULL_37_52]OGZ89220.1 MAG: hypothetical protein A2444_01800 [Candidatus Staskawiczbacteria bacterium RIFOXYC2_FULL_37_19]OGZ89936.1 MAG: hypothetical protein A2581_04045 [Candidatus Staskawiczbacteria bacterium RIFOXYD1_FULL_37_110]OGZ93508.1 MAG: hypothetical protein A2528_02850 [Candidatus Stask